MPRKSNLPLGEVNRLIDQLCDRFEDGWRTGSPPVLEEFLRQAPQEVRPGLFRGVLEIERDYRRKEGQPVSADEARDRFAGLGPWAVAIVEDIFPDEPCLILDVIHGPYAGRSFPLAGHATFTIGRHPGQHICLGDDPHLSRTHCLVEVNPPLIRVVDLGSKTGTVVNGEKVPQANLRDGDEVRAGLTVFRVRIPSADGFGTLSFSESLGTTSYHLAGPPTVPGYRIGRELGRGGMGVVHLATREADGRELAVKSLLPAIPPTRTALGRFLRESAILRDLSHPNIVEFCEAGSSGPLVFFIMEYVPGVSAEKLLKEQGTLPPARVLAWARQFLEALAYAHEEGYVHRDMKPSNLLVVGPAGSELVKVSDFGLARAYEDSSMSGLTIANASGGTPGFMPPEQVTNFRSTPGRRRTSMPRRRRCSNSSRAGASTERCGTQHEMLARILVEDPIPLRPDSPAVPEPFGSTIRRALARDPDRRFHVRTMLAALTR